ncbi:HIT family protein [Planococcus sp. CPCC 101016]|uniref:HIT family protein n=1 Tax=Planococcus sp. CPCC 101016 TaxID=2599617 RepID=UPI0011B6C82F|nr:HIT family protein [Planococcus sp. CPCC 101016]TWT07717.1 HIT family protein [Planococcus sp. CPCC 101016]
MSKEANCPFCNPHQDENQNIVFENETCYFLQHAKEQDVLEGSGVIVPKIHRSDTFQLSQEEWNDTYELLHKAKEYLEYNYSPDGFTLGWNVGKASNQSVNHSHLHVIPRYNDEPFAGRGIRYWLKQPGNKRRKQN